ncbi:hypothetical protein B296_00008851 [Ensete ventricosum]|uniref:Protein kinase domain-containing protein n=1 Tax=Ensete ventricosum TaxID=4639 RepID=A0A427B9J5_ENSVE|nr:hypothetical protein B296_00008851 [Ensete ventricosum]
MVLALYRSTQGCIRRLLRGRKKQEKEGEPRTVLPSNGEAVARLLETSAAGEPRDGTADENLTRLLLTHARRRCIDDFSSARGEENETSSPCAGRRKRRDVNPHTYQLKLCDFGSAKVLPLFPGESGVDQLVEIIKVG